MRAALLTLLLLLAIPAWAVTHPDEKLRDPAQEARALNLTRQLRCVVCQNESIEDSQADIARDLRLLVRRQILEGKTDADITGFLEARYGDYILLNPPVTPRTYVLWLAPVVLLAIGGIIAFANQPRRRRKS